MGVFDKFMSAIRINNDDDYEEDEFYDEEDDFEEEDEEIEEKPKKKGFFKRIFGGHSDEDMDDEYDFEAEDEPVPSRHSSYTAKREAAPARKTSSNITPLRQTRKNMEVRVIKPANMEETKEIADTLISGRTVVLNLEGLDVEVAQRVIDFSSGACYSIEGSLQKVSSYIFILTPKNVGITGDITDILGSSLPTMRNNL